jgi:hypothetical protein
MTQILLMLRTKLSLLEWVEERRRLSSQSFLVMSLQISHVFLLYSICLKRGLTVALEISLIDVE